MASPVSVDVLVVGSGASGLAAAVSAQKAGATVALAAKGSLQSCNSAKAQGGIQAAFGDDDSPEQHADDVWKSSHETADRALVELLTSEAPSAIHWLEQLGVEFTRENGGGPPPPPRGGGRPRRPPRGGAPPPPAGARRASACSRSATAPVTRSRPRCAKRSRAPTSTRFPSHRSPSSHGRRTAGAHAAGITRSTPRRWSSQRAGGVIASLRSAASFRRTIPA